MQSRRKFISKCLGSVTFVIGGAFIVSSCDSKVTGKDEKKEKKAVTDPCDDLSEISQDEIEKRKKFGYVKETQVPESFCGNCGLFLPPLPGKECGGCLLFKGPVHTHGRCIQYAPKTT
jgi:hypothetical protein